MKLAAFILNLGMFFGGFFSAKLLLGHHYAIGGVLFVVSTGVWWVGGSFLKWKRDRDFEDEMAAFKKRHQLSPEDRFAAIAAHHRSQQRHSK